MFEQYLEMPASKWLGLIENESLRTKAMKHAKNYPGNPGLLCSDIREALFHAFNWEKTEEGEFYWLNVYNSKIQLKEDALVLVEKKMIRKDVFILSGIVSTVCFASFWFLK